MLKYFSWGGGGEGGGVEVAKRMQDGRMSGVRPPRKTHTHTHTHTSGAKPTLAVRIKNSSESIGAPDKAKPTPVRTSCTIPLSHLQQCL